jgi:hypothetical protein
LWWCYLGSTTSSEDIMRYAIWLGVSKAGEDDGVLHADSLAREISEKNPANLVRIFDTYEDRLVVAYRNGKEQHRG